MNCITSFKKIFIASAAVFFLTSGIAIGQTPGTGAISGVVTDPSNRVVVGAEVVAVSDATHTARTVVTTSTGFYRLPLLLPGSYTVTAKQAGFADRTSTSVEVTASQTVSLNVALSVASDTQNLQVQSRPETAELESSTLGGLVDETAIRSLPLSTRNFTQILGLSPGVVVDLPNVAALGNGTQNVASDGAMPVSNNIQFNGIDANNMEENSSATAESSIVGLAIPTPDSIQEFRVQTANFDAAYGRSSGANVDLISKSGTNQFHGSAWEFVRNNIFNANDFFNKRDLQPRAELKQNQFGATIGGPIFKDRTFFFLAYQGSIQVNGLGGAQHPTLPLLTSDRSAATLGAQFCPAGHLDNVGQPALGYQTVAGGTQIACDGSNINPVALAILNTKFANGQFAVPSPQVALPISPTDPNASDELPMGESTFSSPAYYRENQFTVDIDQKINEKNALAGRFFYARSPETLPFSPNGGANVPGWPTKELSQQGMFVLSDTHVFNSKLVNNARAGYIMFDGNSSITSPIKAQAVGEGTPTGPGDANSTMPAMFVGGLIIGDAGNPSQAQHTNTFVWQDTVALTKGHHEARFGVEVKRNQLALIMPVETDGLLQIATFQDFLLGQSAAQNGSPQGLSNVSSTTGGGGIFRRDQRSTDFAGFAQDDIKLLPKLTINAGLRYEIFGAPTDTQGRLGNFDVSSASTGPVPVTGTFSGFTLPSNYKGTFPTGVVKTSYAGLSRTQHGNVSPRLGFVWQVTNKPVLVVRGGFGVYFDEHSGTLGEQTLTQPPFATLNINGGTTQGPATLQSPFVPLVLPNSSYPIFQPRTPTSIPFIEGTNPNLQNGRTEEYNLNVEYALGRGYLLDVGYVGTNSAHRPGQINFNQALLASPGKPVNGETTNSTLNVTARLPYQGVSAGSLSTQSTFMANYNSLQASITHHLQHGFQLQGSYTWSKNLDEVANEGGLDVFELNLPTNDQNNLLSSYGLAGDDRDQRLVVNFTWSAPKFKTLPTMARFALTDWTFSGIGVAQAGAALSVFDGNAGSVYGDSGVRAQATGLNPSTKGSIFSRVQNGYLSSAAFTRAPEIANGTSIADEDFGNSGVGIVRGPGQHSIDLAVERAFPLWFSNRFIFRAEAFNLTNTPQFGNPNTNLGYGNALLPQVASSNFGRITSEEGGQHPRIIQFAAKYQF